MQDKVAILVVARLCFQLAVGLLACSCLAHGQTVDTLDWRRYYPLVVGDQWHYRDSASGGLDKVIVEDDTLINGKAYVVRSVYAWTPETSLLSLTERRYQRYSDEGAYIVEARILPGDTAFTDVWAGGPCTFQAPFDSVVDCDELQARVRITGGYGGTAIIGMDTIEVAAIKVFETVSTVFETAADIGVVSETGDFGSTGTLEFAHVGGSTFGHPIVPTSVANQRLPGNFAVDIYPLPARGRATMRIQPHSVGSAWIRVVNVLGQTLRVIRTRVDGVVEHTLDVSDLPQGHYIVIVEDGRQMVIRKLIVVR